MFKVDLHVHTSLGSDSLIEPEELVLHSCQAGLDAVCVTEHHSYEVSEPFEEISRKTGFPIFRGMEYSAEEGHLLIFGVKAAADDFPIRLPMQRIIDRIRQLGGVAVPAHPYQRGLVGGALGDRVLRLRGVTALETINGSASPHENKRASEAAARMGIYGTGGSDAHGLPVLGRACTMFPLPLKTEEDLVLALRRGGYTPCWNGK